MEEGALAGLAAVAGGDRYDRVRRRGLLVFVFLAAASEQVPLLEASDVEPLFKQVLLPQASSPDPDVREACCRIAHSLAVVKDLGGGIAVEAGPSSVGHGSTFAGLWAELSVALARGATAAADGDSTAGAGNNGIEAVGVTSAELGATIEWPPDWRGLAECAA